MSLVLLLPLLLRRSSLTLAMIVQVYYVLAAIDQVTLDALSTGEWSGARASRHPNIGTGVLNARRVSYSLFTLCTGGNVGHKWNLIQKQGQCSTQRVRGDKKRCMVHWLQSSIPFSFLSGVGGQAENIQ